MSTYNIVASTEESTVVSEYTAICRTATQYQSETDLEHEFIDLLIQQGYQYLTLANEVSLISNLRIQLQNLNNFIFTDSEWTSFFNECIANPNDGIVEKTRKIQDDYIQLLKREDGSIKNIYLLDKKNIHNNNLQVINQYQEIGGTYQSRYDVTILVNGLPLIHIELKRRGVSIREAFNQIKRYQRDSFWASSGLYEYIQIFVISNGTYTKYYSNTTRSSHLKENKEDSFQKHKKTSNSFEFTSYWADANNKIIADLVDFSKTFFAKHTLLSILTRYCVFTSENLLLVMRPYQIAATEKIINRILISSNYQKTASIKTGGYIWHTTGSGKTLTSFKTAQIASKLDCIDKVLFVVDRKDLDYQTMKEYDKFEKGAANSNTSTRVLQQQLENPNARIIITTIQKLDVFVRNPRNNGHEIYTKKIVIIFDECHRSQFGDMHERIVDKFKKYHIFGFTGTPIFPKNSGKTNNPLLRTTSQAFGDQLHTYTIINAINDGNVLPFRIDFINTIKQNSAMEDQKIHAIDIEKAMNSPIRIREIATYILDHFDQKTKKGTSYSFKGKSITGFNSILAVSSIPSAMKYYSEFKSQLSNNNRKLVVATIFSYSPNDDEMEDVLPDESFENEKLDATSRGFLESAISDYNTIFNTNFDTSSEKFQNYYKDLSLRMKNREIDLLIVVNMFLTGFDATTLNTLWVDKDLKQHGLIQAFSRTNRILNSVKTFGNIVCFRDLKQATDEALALFGDKDAGGVVLLKTYDDYYNGFEEKGEHKPGYVELINEITHRFPLGEDILGEAAKKEFIQLYGSILRFKNILQAFDDFVGNQILSSRDYQDYQGIYLTLYQEFRKDQVGDRENINDDLVFELELVKQIEVNIDYILLLVEQYRASNCQDTNILVAIKKASNSTLELRSKKDLIDQFIEKVNLNADQNDWSNFIQEKREIDLVEIIASENLKPLETRRLIEIAFRDGYLKTTGIDIDRILPPISRFASGRMLKKSTVIGKLLSYFEKYVGLI
jgi:type I restriction enzyme R subunit